MKKNVVLYNVLFPVWMLAMLPWSWLVVIPGNFIIDSLVMLLAIKVLKVGDPKGFYKHYILKVFGYGFLADFLAVIPMWYGMVKLGLGGSGADGLDLTLPGVLIAMVLIFLFDYFGAFEDCEKPLRRKLALIYAIFTAPYTFLLPANLIY